MRRALLVSAALVTCCAVAVRAQNPVSGGTIKLSDVAGTWANKAMVGPKDSVVVPSVITATADGKGWTMEFPNRDPIPVRVVAIGGDSIVTEAGPYPSMLRPGQTVQVLHTIGHYKGDKMTGTFEARYAPGDVVRGRIEATRMK
jgi:hypothetical protein